MLRRQLRCPAGAGPVTIGSKWIDQEVKINGDRINKLFPLITYKWLVYWHEKTH